MERKSAYTIVTLSTFGTILEWAEYTFFAYMADVLSRHFFPIENPQLAILKTYGIFATSYFMRPLGALIFGSIGDRLGRKPALMISMLLMGIATSAIGFLPTYQQVGQLAAILLMLCRLLQGIAVAGEFHGAIIYLHEHARTRPFLMGSFAPFAAAAGMSLGALAATLTTLSSYPMAWRIPFLCSGLLCVAALILRQYLSESPQFIQIEQFKQRPHLFAPIVSVFKENRVGLFKAFSMGIFISVFVYIGNIFFKILSIRNGLSPASASEIVTFGQCLAAGSILVFGMKADAWGGKRMCLFGLKLAILGGPFILFCAQSGQSYLTLLGQMVYAIINGLCSAPMMTLLLNKFKTHHRYSGSALGWSLAAAMFGGTALMIAEWMVSFSGWNLGPGLYISAAAMLAHYFMKGEERSVIASEALA